MKKFYFKLSLVVVILSLIVFNQVKSQSNQYLEFNGYNSATSLGNYVSVPNASTLIAGSTTFSMTGWFLDNNLSYGQGMIGFRGNPENFYLCTLNNGIIEARFINSANTTYNIDSPTGIMIPNIWQHFAFVYDGTHVYLYLNGTLVSSIAASGSFATTIMPFDIGLCPLSGFNFYYNGGIDEVSLWKKALTASQIQNIMTHEISVDSATAQGLLLYYKFNQGIPGSNNTSITKLHTEVNSPIYDGVINNFTMTGVVSNFEGTIDTSSQIITFSTIPTKLINSPPFVLTATASSGLTVGYNIVSGPAILSGDTVILAGTPGTVVIKAYQHGNAQYDSATSIINSFDVVDPNINVPKIDPRHPLAGNVHVTPPLSKIQLAAIATINYTPLFSVQSVSFKIDGQTPTIPTTDFGNGCYTAWWQPSGYGSHTVEILATNNYGAVSDTTFDINIDSTATDTTYQAFSSIWVNSNVPSFVVDGELPSFLGAYDTIIATLSITCPTGGCDPWDRISSVEAKSHEGNWFEIIRYITPYGIACTHKIVLTDYESLLKGKVSFRVNLGTLGNGYLYTLKFDYKKGTPPHKYSQVTNIWENNYNFGYYPNLQPVSVFNYTFPSGVVSSKLKLISTGHGSGSDNTNNAAEFYEATHHIHINNVDSFAQHNWVTCNPNPDNCSPQNGTWQYSRAGWCPGSIAHPFDYNLTTYIPSNNIAIKYVLFPGYIDMCSPAYPPCVSGTTCTDCSGGTIPILDVDCNLVNFFDNPPGNPVIQAVKELKDFEIAVYPNPSTGIFNLTSNNKPENVCNVTIYNLFGNHVKEFQWNGENTTFNLSNNAAGIYIMKVSNKDKVEIKKLMVR